MSYRIGFDIGSTTIKAVVMNENGEILYKSYERHKAQIREMALAKIEELKDLLGDAGFAHGLKWLQSLFALGILLFGPVPGMLADAFGSYEPAYALFFLMTAVSLLLMGWVYARTGAGAPPRPGGKTASRP